jgi:hypothetical protein
MTTSTYKGYTIVRVGLSHHVYRPGREGFAAEFFLSGAPSNDDYLTQSAAAAMRWIQQDRAAKIGVSR